MTQRSTLANIATTASPDITRFRNFAEYCEVIACTQTTLETHTGEADQ